MSTKEPAQIGTVVLDRNGVLWVRSESAPGGPVWLADDEDAIGTFWEDIDNPTVVHQGYYTQPQEPTGKGAVIRVRIRNSGACFVFNSFDDHENGCKIWRHVDGSGYGRRWHELIGEIEILFEGVNDD